MEHKQKQWIKGLMLSTVLGLGVSVAGDISHAAGNEISQTQIVNEWSKNKLYNKGDIVTYEGVQYTALTLTCVDQPNITPSQWEVVKGDDFENKDPEDHKKVWEDPNQNSSGVKALTNGVTNGGRATFLSQTDSNRPANNGWNMLYEKTYYVENNHWVYNTEKVIDGIKYSFDDKGVATQVGAQITVIGNQSEWNENKTYSKGDMVTYKGIQYEAKLTTWNSKPDVSMHWKAMNGAKPEWNENKTYSKGDMVTYKGIQYEAKLTTWNSKPDVSWHWKPMNGENK